MVEGNEAFQPGLTGNENDPDTGHHPYVRHVRLGWHRDKYGQWVPDAEDESHWEVICRQCGDTEGPVDEQPKSAKEVRGPYPTHHKAEHAAKKHERKFAPPLRWLPGDVPLPRL